jgi:hypothetical protein
MLGGLLIPAVDEEGKEMLVSQLLHCTTLRLIQVNHLPIVYEIIC